MEYLNVLCTFWFLLFPQITTGSKSSLKRPRAPPCISLVDLFILCQSSTCSIKLTGFRVTPERMGSPPGSSELVICVMHDVMEVWQIAQKVSPDQSFLAHLQCPDSSHKFPSPQPQEPGWNVSFSLLPPTSQDRPEPRLINRLNVKHISPTALGSVLNGSGNLRKPVEPYMAYEYEKQLVKGY